MPKPTSASNWSGICVPLPSEAQRLRGIELSLIRKVTQAAPPGAINLALGELGFPLPQILREEALRLLQTATPVYTPNAGLSELRSAIAALYPGSDPEDICVCNGAEEALFVSLLSILDTGDAVAIPDPDYPAYAAICALLEAKVVRLPYLESLQAADLDEWERLIAGGVEVLVLSHPSNPAGHVFSEADARRLACLCEEYEVTLVVDEIYRELFFCDPLPSFHGHLENLILLGGVSKSHCMSGWRLGWALVPPTLSAAVVKARQYVSTCSNWLSQQLAIYALSPLGGAAAEEVLDQLKTCRAQALERLGHFGGRLLAPPATPYLMLKVDADDLDICARLAKKGVVCVPGSAFGKVSRGWLRLNYAVPNTKLATGLDIICDELHFH
jgi:aspartate/methionine/tyrosine aminotransferase